MKNDQERSSNDYEGASFAVGNIIELLGVPVHALNDRCLKAVQDNCPDILKNIYLFRAIEILWDCDYSSDLIEDLKKAMRYLRNGTSWNSQLIDDFFPKEQLKIMNEAAEVLSKLIDVERKRTK
jgi:hypothetical protein